MKTVKIIIEKSKDHYSSYAENVAGVYGGGNTAAEAKQSALEGIRLLKENNTPDNIPAILKGEYQVVFKFDTESLLNHYRGIFTNAGLERITGIKQRQVQHYTTGKKPRPAQRMKIQSALHNLGKELLAVEL